MKGFDNDEVMDDLIGIKKYSVNTKNMNYFASIVDVDVDVVVASPAAAFFVESSSSSFILPLILCLQIGHQL